MKNIKIWTLFAIVVLGNHFAQSQDKPLTFNIKFDTIQVGRYNPISKSLTYICLQTRYGNHRLINPQDAPRLIGKKVKQIDLVYTQHPKNADFTLLNQKRLAALQAVAPQLFENPDIHWSLVVQTDCDDANASQFLHGFTIRYQPTTEATYTPYVNEGERLKQFISGKMVLNDSTVLKVMGRNPTWKNMAIVGDFTGSMTPYIAQIVLWHKLNLGLNKKKIKRFVFFNDGDQKADQDKEIGATGGIYHTPQLALDSVINTAVATIEGGFGGDGPENDVEALLFAQKRNPAIQNLVLIADNWSTMRDVALIKDIKKPVRVVLCGVVGPINVEYLNLAYRSKGSLHTIEQDINHLIKAQEGTIIRINGYQYRLSKGQFKQI